MAKKQDRNDAGTKDYIKIFAERLNAVVTGKLNWSQGEFGRRLGKTQATAGRYLSGKVSPGFDMLGKIEDVTRVPIARYFESGAPLPKPQDLSDDVRAAIQEASAENSELLKQIAGQLGPAIAKLKGDDESIPTTVKAAPKDKFTSFVNELLRDAGITANFYRLLDEGAPKETLRSEFLREVTAGLLSEGGKQAKQTRKVLTELLEKEKGDKG